MSRSSSPDELSSCSESSTSTSSSHDEPSPEPPSSPFPSSALASRLPLELVGMIIKEATKTGSASRGYWQERASRLCLVSRSLLPFARGGLYHTLDEYHCRSSGYEEDYYGSSDSPLGVSADRDRLSRTLKQNPALGRLCRDLRIEVGDADYKEDVEYHAVWARIKDTLHACSEVHSLILVSDDSFGEEPLDDIFAELADGVWGSQLRSLTMSYKGDGTQALLSCLPRLRHLRLLEQDDTLEDPPPPTSFPFSLLSLHASQDVPDYIIEPFITSSKKTLRSLTLPSTLMLAQPALLPALIALEDLVVDLSDPDNLHDNTSSEERLQDVFALLGGSTTMRSLSFHAVLPPRHVPPLTGLPASLTSLDLSSIPVTFSTVSEYLSLDPHPHLRTLKCDRPHWSNEDKAEVVELCEELDVELQGEVMSFWEKFERR